MTASARALLVLLLFACRAHADMIVCAPQPRVSAGAPLQLDLMITNTSSESLTVEVPAPLYVRFETRTSLATLPFAPERSGAVEVAPGAFVKIRLRGDMPVEAQGVATLTADGLQANAVMVQIDAAEPASLAKAAERKLPTPEQISATLVDKPPPIPLSTYEPVYFLLGGDDGLNAKFQISFRYQLFDGQGPLARRWRWLDDLYLSFSQTSLWDLDELSKPFKDSSYRPRLFFANYDLTRWHDARFRIGLEAGAGHESNGKDGEDSRSYNMFYLRPMLTIGDPDGLRAYVAPLIHNYVADDENRDLKNYRGYVDLLFGVGSKGGLDFSAILRKGTRSDYGSIEVNASYPLSKLSGGDLTGWLMLQYFGGYGESLIDYNHKLDAQLRLGVAVAL